MIPGGSVGSQWGWGKGQVLYRNRAEFKKKIIFFKKKKKHTINQKNLFLFYSFFFFFEGGGGDSFCFYLAIQKDKLLKFSEKPITQKSCGFCGRNLR